MSIKIDLSKFKHVKSDKHSATLQHKDGHVLTIAIAAMKPEHQEQLKLMAKGGDVLASEEDKKGVSTQGKDVRHAHKAKRRGDKEEHAHAMDYAKEEARGRAEMERHNKPKIQGLADGGIAQNPAKGLDFDAYAQERDKNNFASEHGLPCLNPNCKSHGRPHPNCRCYSGSGWNDMAEGGHVEGIEGMDKHFCVGKKPHHPNCEYYAQGGVAGAHWDGFTSPVSNPGAPIYPSDVRNKKSPEQRDAEQKAADQQRAAQDASFRAQHPQEPEFDDSGYTTVRSAVDEGYAKGGKVHISDEELDRRDRKQGHEVKRQQEFFKHTESGRQLIDMANKKADKIRDHKAEGGKVEEHTMDYHKLLAEKKAMNHKENNQPVKRKKYAGGSEEPVSENDQAPYYLQSDVPEQSNSPQIDMPHEYMPKSGPDVEDKLYEQIRRDNPGMPEAMARRQATDAAGGPSSSNPTPSVQRNLDSQEQPQQAAQEPQEDPNQNPQDPFASVKVPDVRFNQAELDRADNLINNPDAEMNPMKRWADYKQEHMNELTQHDKDWDDDLRNGHITPQTYESLFHSKTTLGKISSLFGLLISGAGSGLAHQPNAVLEMMNNEIKNDLEAQKNSKANGQNFLKMAQNYVLNKAQARHLNAQTAAQAYALANMSANRSALHKMIAITNSLPQGSPQRAAAEAQLAALNQGVQNENFNLADRASTASSYYKVLGITNGQGTQGDQNSPARQKARLMLGPQGEAMNRYYEDHTIPGVYGESKQPTSKEDKNKIVGYNTLDRQLKDVLSSIDRYSSIRGNVDPKVLGEMAVKAHEAGMLYNKTLDGLGMTEGRMNWLGKQIPENPQTFLELMRGSKEKIHEIMKNNLMRREEMLKGLDFPAQTVDVIDPKGRPGKMPVQNIDKAMKMGYKRR